METNSWSEIVQTDPHHFDNGVGVPIYNEYDDFMEWLNRSNNDDVIRDIPEHFEKCNTRWNTGNYAKRREMRIEQRYAICAGLRNADIPNDLARWVSAFAVPRSKIYSYMPVPNIEKKVKYRYWV